MSPSLHTASLAILAIHADASLSGEEVAPAISTSTTFRHPTAAQLAARPDLEPEAWDPSEPSRHIYSRETQPVGTRVEKVLEALIGQSSLVYSSGIAACWAVLLHVAPDVIAVDLNEGYFGFKGSLEIYQRVKGKKNCSIISLDDEYPTDKKVLVWVETPLNPTGESRSIAAYSNKAKAVGAVLCVDSTFAPPPLQDPFKWGADIVMHSGTKYFCGHSDALIGVVSVKTKEAWHELFEDRIHHGACAGSLETWLLLRSLKTLNLRIIRQSKSATALAQWLHSLTTSSAPDGLADVVEKVWHTSLQADADKLLGEGKQMTAGNACFSILLKTREMAQKLPDLLSYFVHATSLGGVESLIEWRLISDSKSDPRLLRLSIGVEDYEDLRSDFEQALRQLTAPSDAPRLQVGA